uniref:NOC3-like protein n=1 Tax=Meloidogyne incognita TaxID=6306 RepID=A0A914MQP4_MELIC
MKKPLAATKKAKRQRIKTQRKFSKSARRGKLRKYAKDKIIEVRQARQNKSNGRFDKIRNDWLRDREMRQNDSDSDYTDNEEEEYKEVVKQQKEEEEDENEEMDLEEIKKHFLSFGGFEEEKEMLLPIKIGGKLINRVKMDVEEEKEDCEVEEKMEIELKIEENEKKQGKASLPNLTNLTDQQLKELYTKLMEEAKIKIATNAELIIADPNENISKFRILLKMAFGEDLTPLIREDIQKLATATLSEVFVNILPGYKIHTLTDVEKGQKMKKETKRLASFEQLLLQYYVKYLKFCEKTANKLFSTKIDHQNNLSFSAQFGILCGKCLCLLLEKCSHFNYASNIISCLARLSLCKCKNLLDSICSAFSTMFSDDCSLQISLNGVKAISKLVEKKKAYVPAQLISTLLFLNIKEIDRDGTEAKRLKKEKLIKKKQVANKKRRKLDKQIGKLENELLEAIESKTFSTKLQISTQIMHNVFLIYFKILKRMPQTELLSPVLQGLSKFVHLISIDFYDDLMQHLGRLVEQKLDKQIGKLENELLEAIESKTFSTKLQISTQIMHNVFLIYFKILKRMPQTELLSPVLQGLSKFVHLISIDFYDDLMQHLGRLVEQKQLKVTETLNCIHTASHIFTGEGQATIEVDLQKFYKALYNVMPNICFQPEEELKNQVLLLIESIQLLLIKRRKSVSIKKAASFIKRLALIIVGINLIDENCAAGLLLILRRIFLTFPSLKPMIGNGQNKEDEEDFIVDNGQYRPDCSDPDYSNSVGTSIKGELELILKNQNTQLVKMLVLHLLTGLNLTGKYKLDVKWTSLEPSELFKTMKNVDDKNNKNERRRKLKKEFYENLENFAKKIKTKNSKLQGFGSSNFCSTLNCFIEANKNC